MVVPVAPEGRAGGVMLLVEPLLLEVPLDEPPLLPLLLAPPLELLLLELLLELLQPALPAVIRPVTPRHMSPVAPRNTLVPSFMGDSSGFDHARPVRTCRPSCCLTASGERARSSSGKVARGAYAAAALVANKFISSAS
jgi:hypothetical protein